MSEQITTREELDALPDRSVVLDSDGDAWAKEGDAWVFGINRWDAALLLGSAPLAVLHIPGRPHEPQRVRPSREDVAEVIFTAVAELSEQSASPWSDARAMRAGADGVLALLDAQPTVAEVQAQALREAATVARLDRIGGLSWIARAVEAWLNVRADTIAASGREVER